MQTWKEKLLYAEQLYVIHCKGEEASEYLQKLVDEGCIPALLLLTRLYQKMLNNKEKAAYYLSEVKENQQWFEDQINDCTPESYYHLGCFYELIKQCDQAIKYYQISADNGHLFSLLRLGNIYVSRNEYKKAFDYYVLLEKGCPPLGKFILGECYLYGNGVNKDIDKGIELLKKAAEEGDIRAQSLIGESYLQGNGVPRNIEQGLKWLESAAEGRDVHALVILGECYLAGRHVIKDEKTGFMYYKKAADRGYAKAQYYVCQCYLHGIGISWDLEKAYDFLEKSADGGFAPAQYKLGQMCYLGEDEQRGIELLQQAAYAKNYNALIWMVKSHMDGASGYSKDMSIALKYCGHFDPTQRTGDWWHCLANICCESTASELEKALPDLKVILDCCREKEPAFFQLAVRVYCLSAALEAYKRELPDIDKEEKMETIASLLKISVYKLEHFGEEKKPLIRKGYPKTMFTSQAESETDVVKIIPKMTS